MFKSTLCVALLLGLTLAVPSGGAGESGKCSNHEDAYYDELGCKPEALDAAGCPTSYDCSNLLLRGSEKCHYKGKTYDEGQKLDNVDPCIPQCNCQSSPGSDGTNRLALNCINNECPEYFHGPPKTGCYHSYTHERCCSVKEVCPTEAESKSLEVCEVDGKTYKLGQKFNPEDEPCKACICQKGYEGKNEEPFCEKIKCNIELHNGGDIAEGCSPIYYGDKGCCPIQWRCPTPSDSIVAADPSVVAKSADSGKTCKFGNLTMKIGDKLNVGSDKVECTCNVPPHPVCVMPETPYPA